MENVGRNVGVRNSPGIDEEPCIHFGQIPNMQAFDVDGLAARICSQADRRRVLAPAKLAALVFPEPIEAGLIQHGGVGVRSYHGTLHPGCLAPLDLRPDTALPPMPD